MAAQTAVAVVLRAGAVPVGLASAASAGAVVAGAAFFAGAAVVAVLAGVVRAGLDRTVVLTGLVVTGAGPPRWGAPDAAEDSGGAGLSGLVAGAAGAVPAVAGVAVAGVAFEGVVAVAGVVVAAWAVPAPAGRAGGSGAGRSGGRFVGDVAGAGRPGVVAVAPLDPSVSAPGRVVDDLEGAAPGVSRKTRDGTGCARGACASRARPMRAAFARAALMRAETVRTRLLGGVDTQVFGAGDRRGLGRSGRLGPTTEDIAATRRTPLARTPDGPPPPPPVQRLRLRYAKRGRLRFTSHRDIQRAFERALRRATVPIAYSAGFSPHPKVSYAGAASTGAASEAEYLEIQLTRPCDPPALREALDAALPVGLDVLEVVEARPGALADRLEASEWEVVLPHVTAAEASGAVSALLGRTSVDVERLTRSGRRTFDARGAIARLEVLPPRSGRSAAARAVASGDGSCAILHLVVRHATPAVRPDDVLAALLVVADLAPPSPPQVTRLAQGPLDEVAGSVSDPLTPDRDAADT